MGPLAALILLPPAKVCAAIGGSLAKYYPNYCEPSDSRPATGLVSIFSLCISIGAAEVFVHSWVVAHSVLPQQLALLGVTDGRF